MTYSLTSVQISRGRFASEGGSFSLSNGRNAGHDKPQRNGQKSKDKIQLNRNGAEPKR